MAPNDCPAASAAQRIGDALLRRKLVAVHIAAQDSGWDEPLRVNFPRRIRIPDVRWLAWFTAGAIVASLLGCGAPAPRAGSPSSAGAVGAALPKQIDEMGARLVAGRATVDKWEAFQRGMRYGVDPVNAVRGMR